VAGDDAAFFRGFVWHVHPEKYPQIAAIALRVPLARLLDHHTSSSSSLTCESHRGKEGEIAGNLCLFLEYFFLWPSTFDPPEAARMAIAVKCK